MRRRERCQTLMCILIGAALLSGCGFKPLHYRGGAETSPVVEKLGAIYIYPMQDRTGQQMHNLLRDRLNPGGQPTDAAYGLKVFLAETLLELNIRQDATATRTNLTVEANFTLYDLDSGEALYSGSSRSTNSYDILENQFATSVAEADARKRSLRVLSDAVKTRLAVYFSSTGS